MNDTDIDAILRGNSSRKRWLLLSVAVAAVIAAGVAAFLLTRPDAPDVVAEPERAETFMGRLSTEVELSGSALAERSATLSFEVAGVVTSVAVSEGDEVRAGGALASLDGADAQRRVETAEVQLRQAQLRLENLLAGAGPSALAAANQSIASSESQVVSAEQALALLSEPPGAADIAGAEQAVASALREISGAEQALALLSEPPGAADIASAEQAVASALREISGAEQALALLSEPPGAADIANAEQAVASALGQISGAEQALAALLVGPTDAVLSESRSAVTQAQVRLADATRLAEESDEALTAAFDDFCERYSGIIASDEVVSSTCTGEVPLSDAQIDALRESFEDRSSVYENLGNALIDAGIAFVAAAADRDSAHSALTSSEERLADLLEPVSEDDVYQAEQAVEAAKASHAAATARLEDLRETPDADDLYQAEQAVEAAKASHAAAVARLEDLRSAADEGDIEKARASLESARAGLASAQAHYDELAAGPTGNEIEQQRQDIRLAELSVEEARAALADLTVFAPFNGTVEAVNIRPGDRVTANSAAFTLSTSERMLIALTVTEEDLLQLEAGQTGLASFDAIDGIEYPVRVESVGRVPNVEQGVVTYDVEARILTGPEPADEAGESTAAIRPGSGFGGGPPRSLPPGLELPEGVTIQQVIRAVAAGAPLPEGVVLPEELQGRNLQAMAQAFLRGQGMGGPPGAAASQGAARDAGASRPIPAPGMSASVTILTEVRDEAVLAPVSAVRQLDGAWFVNVPAPPGDETGDAAGGGSQRIFVEVGESDGLNVEIANGIEAGAVLLIGADNAGIAFSATRQLPSADTGFGPGGGGPGPGGGGPR